MLTHLGSGLGAGSVGSGLGSVGFGAAVEAGHIVGSGLSPVGSGLTPVGKGIGPVPVGAGYVREWSECGGWGGCGRQLRSCLLSLVHSASHLFLQNPFSSVVMYATCRIIYHMFWNFKLYLSL